MKLTKLFLIGILMISGTGAISAQLKIGKTTIDTKKATKAITDLATSVTLSDADIANLSKESVAWMDAHNKIDNGEYAERLQRLTEGITEVDGLPLNFKVYDVVDINAFATGDGSIRVFSSLMDIMDDDELMAIIGHEIGHVVHHDVRNAMKNAYLASAVMNAAGAVNGTVSKLTDSQLGELASAFMDAKFSQKQEYAADDYGFQFAVDNGFSPYAMANSLEKLVELSKGQKANAIRKMFSSHPDSEKRAKKMREKAEKYEKKNK